MGELLKSGRIANDEAQELIADIENRMKKLSREKMSKDDRNREKPKFENED
ncbi:MAG: hypothetical protein IPM77_16505 [Crocinitomicaceae bacterium]|nr:hypothetical protein [Crocinitomicaceae bacterium]